MELLKTTILTISGNSDDPHLEDADIQFHASCVYIIMYAFVWNWRRIVLIMESVYHYTSICNDFEPVLSSILHPDWIDLRATYYLKFNKDDYLWVKNHKDNIIKELCEEKGLDYEEDSFDFKPYIISFCTNGRSDYMWDKYANNQHGVMLEFNQDVLRETHHNELFGKPGTVELDCFCPCLYVDEKGGEPDLSEIRSSLLGSVEKIDECGIGKWTFQEKLGLAMNAVKKRDPYSKEEEWRYITLYPVASVAQYNPDSVDLCDISEPDAPPSEWYKHILFPKEALVGITVGSKVSNYNYKCVKNIAERCGFSPNIIHKQFE